MSNNSNIAILLATYNSERYIREQLDSLFSQSIREFTIYIHDDGSTDNTISIINDYCERNKNIILLDDPIKHRLAASSFMWLLENIDADYYMFCDHDDIWLQNKIELSLNKLKEVERSKGKDTPCAVHTDLIVVDDNLNVIDNSFWKRSKIKPNILENFNYIGVCNCATGCTLIFNQAAKECSIPYFDCAPMHDWWVVANVLKYGYVTHIDDATILYRQHSDNVVGARNINLKYFINKIISLKTTLTGHKELFSFLEKIEYGNMFKFYKYKLLYLIQRNL